MTIQWDAWDPYTDTGDGPIVAYNVYDIESQPTRITIISANMGSKVSANVTDLSPETLYVFCIRVERVGAGGEGPCSYVSFTTLPVVHKVTTTTEKTETFTTGGGKVEIPTMQTPSQGITLHAKIIPYRQMFNWYIYIKTVKWSHFK